jgi:hypothetical protein
MFMEHKNNTSYPESDKTFTVEELTTITPEHIYRWMCKRVYDKEDPSAEDNPIHARSTTIAYWKKAISYFMPNTATWTIDGTGNPTKSKQINGLIKAVKKKEIRGTGKPPQADRSLNHDEFVQAVDLMGSDGSTIDGRRYQAMIKFQLHLIGRSDDTAHVKKSVLEQSTQFPEYLTVQMRWSKNVQEEKDCPKQIILGSMNTTYCCVLGLSLFLEKWISDGQGSVSQWLFADGTSDSSSILDEQDKEALNCKANYANSFKRAIDSDVFTANEGKLGTNSVKKYAATRCRSGGASKDDTDYRARWKGRRMQDRYTDTELDWSDVNAASKLCVGGICVYKVKDGSGITDEWLAREVAPAISESFGDKVGRILAKPLLWACFDASTVDLVPSTIRHSVTGKFIRLKSTIPDGVNPIDKVEVIASECGGNVSLDEIPNEEGGGDGDGGSALVRSNTQWRTAIYAKASGTSVRVTEMQNNQLAEFAELKRRLKRMEEIIRSIQLAPARGGRQAPRLDAPAVAGPIALLQTCPRTLECLWDEYQNGIGGRKAAREFTRVERGRNKFKYCRRMVVWKCIQRLLERGGTVGTAVRRIHSVYGEVSVTDIINKMRRDERRGGHARLR